MVYRPGGYDPYDGRPLVEDEYGQLRKLPPGVPGFAPANEEKPYVDDQLVDEMEPSPLTHDGLVGEQPRGFWGGDDEKPWMRTLPSRGYSPEDFNPDGTPRATERRIETPEWTKTDKHGEAKAIVFYDKEGNAYDGDGRRLTGEIETLPNPRVRRNPDGTIKRDLSPGGEVLQLASTGGPSNQAPVGTPQQSPDVAAIPARPEPDPELTGVGFKPFEELDREDQAKRKAQQEQGNNAAFLRNEVLPTGGVLLDSIRENLPEGVKEGSPPDARLKEQKPFQAPPTLPKPPETNIIDEDVNVGTIDEGTVAVPSLELSPEEKEAIRKNPALAKPILDRRLAQYDNAVAHNKAVRERNLLKKELKERERIGEQRKMAEGKLLQLDKINQDISNQSIDPTRFFSGNSSRTIFGTLSAAIGGLFLPSLGHNPGLRGIEKMIDRDIEAQRADLQNKRQGISASQSILAQYIQLLGNEEVAVAALRTSQWEAVAAKAKVQAAEAGNMRTAQKALEIDKAAQNKALESRLKVINGLISAAPKSMKGRLVTEAKPWYGFSPDGPPSRRGGGGGGGARAQVGGVKITTSTADRIMHPLKDNDELIQFELDPKKGGLSAKRRQELANTWNLMGNGVGVMIDLGKHTQKLPSGTSVSDWFSRTRGDPQTEYYTRQSVAVMSFARQLNGAGVLTADDVARADEALGKVQAGKFSKAQALKALRTNVDIIRTKMINWLHNHGGMSRAEAADKLRDIQIARLASEDEKNAPFDEVVNNVSKSKDPKSILHSLKALTSRIEDDQKQGDYTRSSMDTLVDQFKGKREYVGSAQFIEQLRKDNPNLTAQQAKSVQTKTLSDLNKLRKRVRAVVAKSAVRIGVQGGGVRVPAEEFNKTTRGTVTRKVKGTPKTFTEKLAPWTVEDKEERTEGITDEGKANIKAELELRKKGNFTAQSRWGTAAPKVGNDFKPDYFYDADFVKVVKKGRNLEALLDAYKSGRVFAESAATHAHGEARKLSTDDVDRRIKTIERAINIKKLQKKSEETRTK